MWVQRKLTTRHQVLHVSPHRHWFLWSGCWLEKLGQEHKATVILLPCRTSRAATVGHYLTDALLFIFPSLSSALVYHKPEICLYLTAEVIIVLQKRLLLCTVCYWLELEFNLVPMLCSGKSLWCFFNFFVLHIWDEDVAAPSSLTLVRPDLNIAWWILKPKSWCFNDMQNPPGKTLLWTQQQHYTCAFKITLTEGLASLSAKVA